jgi:hypothetical protein
MRTNLIILIISVLIVGCAASRKVVYKETPESNVMDFGSSQVLIDKKFVPIGDLKGQIESNYIDPVEDKNIRLSLYLFADTSTGKSEIKRAIAVLLYELKAAQGYWYSEPDFDNYKGQYIARGKANLSGIRCAYLITNVESAFQNALKTGESKGFYMSNDISQGIEIRFAKLIGRQRRVDIIYIESEDDPKKDLERALSFIKFKSSGAGEGEARIEEYNVSSEVGYNVNPEEPWTGIWKVEGHRYFDGTWTLKQNGDTIVSTPNSSFKLEGKVAGNNFKGAIYLPTLNEKYPFLLEISSDSMTFDGKIIRKVFQFNNIILKGKRKE